MESIPHHGSTAEQQSSEPFSLPPYPQMIMEAIEAVNDKNGCNKTTISKHIESTQQILPPSHATLLSYHLNQMKNSGQILLVKNNYVKPDPNAPPKRGRGRPPKQKSAAESTAVPAAVSTDPPRSRGRPPKPKDTSSEIPPKEKSAVGSGRPRGRRPKKARTEPETVSADATAQPAGERRGRGRPPKVKTTVVEPVGC